MAQAQASITGFVRSPREVSTKTGKQVKKFGLPISKGDGDARVTTWVNAEVWSSNKYLYDKLSDGAFGTFFGRLVPEKYVGKDGAEKNSMVLHVESAHLYSPSSNAPQPNESYPAGWDE